jgi:hypothetical protein
MTETRPGPARSSARYTVRVPRAVGRVIDQRAAEWGVTPSSAASRLLDEAIRINLEHQHGALIEAVIERSIAGSLERLGDLSVRAALYGDEARRLALQVLVNAVGVDRARAMRREVHSAAYQRLLEPFEAPAPEGSSAWPAARTPS